MAAARTGPLHHEGRNAEGSSSKSSCGRPLEHRGRSVSHLVNGLVEALADEARREDDEHRRQQQVDVSANLRDDHRERDRHACHAAEHPRRAHQRVQPRVDIDVGQVEGLSDQPA
eukprot:6639140-Prymnesium_polylepis.1